MIKIDDNHIVAGGYDDDGIWYSEDGGITWNLSNATDSGAKALAITNDGTIYAGAYNGDKCVRYSEDNGKTWIQSYFNTIINVISNDMIKSSDGNSVFLAGIGGLFLIQHSHQISKKMSVSSNYWTLSSIGDKYFIAGMNTGICYSNNNDEVWNYVNIKNSECFNLVGSSDQTFITVNGISGGIYYSDDYGKTWSLSPNTDVIISGDCIVDLDTVTILGSSSHGIWYSEDHGHTWNQSNIKSGGVKRVVRYGSLIVACGYQSYGIFISEDNGKTWIRVRTESRYNSMVATNSGVIIGDFNNNGIIYADNFFIDKECKLITDNTKS